MLGVAPDVDAYPQRLCTGLDPFDRAEVGRPAEMIHRARQSGRFVFWFRQRRLRLPDSLGGGRRVSPGEQGRTRSRADGG